MSPQDEAIKLRARLKDGYGELRMLLIHPMETGRRLDRDGKPVPAHHIVQLEVKLNGQPAINGRLGPGVAANPLFTFEFDGVKAGDEVQVRWQDNRGASASASTRFA